MDTVGLDEGDAEDVNGELVQQTLIFVVLSCSELLTSTGSRWGNTCWLCKSLVLNGSTQSFGASLRRTGYNFHYLASCPWVFLFTWFSPRSCSTCGSRLPWSSCWRRGSPPSGRTSSSWPRRARRTPSRAFRCRGNTNHIHTLRKDLWTGKVILLFSVSIQFWTPVYKRSLSQNYWALFYWDGILNIETICLHQGALTAVAELERGQQDLVDSIQCLAYTLGPR